MANYLRENPFYIDTAVNVQPPSWGKIYVKDIKWEGSLAVGSQLVITTGTGGTLVNETIPSGATNLAPLRFGPFGWVNGFNVTTITSGTNITVTITKA